MGDEPISIPEEGTADLIPLPFYRGERIGSRGSSGLEKRSLILASLGTGRFYQGASKIVVLEYGNRAHPGNPGGV
jgi:hypothetical protein